MIEKHKRKFSLKLRWVQTNYPFPQSFIENIPFIFVEECLISVQIKNTLHSRNDWWVVINKGYFFIISNLGGKDLKYHCLEIEVLLGTKSILEIWHVSPQKEWRLLNSIILLQKHLFVFSIQICNDRMVFVNK